MASSKKQVQQRSPTGAYRKYMILLAITVVGTTSVMQTVVSSLRMRMNFAFVDTPIRQSVTASYPLHRRGLESQENGWHGGTINEVDDGTMTSSSMSAEHASAQTDEENELREVNTTRADTSSAATVPDADGKDKRAINTKAPEQKKKNGFPKSVITVARQSENQKTKSSESFGACLKIMDDNHWLVEWLAYHWFALPLRHLIVYIDPKSETDPRPVLERWDGKMDILVWNETIAPTALTKTASLSTPGVLEHRGPHTVFLQDCMKYYKLEMDWKSWIVLVDTDEFIAVNNFTRGSKQEYKYVSRSNVPPNDEPGSVMTMLKKEYADEKARKERKLKPRYSKPHCMRMHRLQMCLNELDEESGNVAIKLPSGSKSANGTTMQVGGRPLVNKDMLTFNFQLGERGRQPKNMVDMGGIPASYFEELDLLKTGNVHNPVPGYCKNLDSSAWEKGPYIEREKSIFQVYHYSGTEEQRGARANDSRGTFGNRTGTPLAEQCYNVPASDLQPWLHGFVNTVGPKEAESLLDGVGRVGIWPTYISPVDSNLVQEKI